MREPFFQMFWNRLSAVGKQNSALCECPRLLHQLRPLEELLCCAEHFLTSLNIFLLRWICLLFWTFFYSAERSPCADYFYAMLIFSVPSICCCDEKFMLHWTFSCCAEHFSLLHWSMFQQCFSCSLAEEFGNLSASSGKWCVMSHLSFKLASTATTTHNVENWINEVLKVVRGVSKLKPAGRLYSLWSCSNRCCSQTTLVPSLWQTANPAVGEHQLSCREYFEAAREYSIYNLLAFTFSSSYF